MFIFIIIFSFSRIVRFVWYIRHNTNCVMWILKYVVQNGQHSLTTKIFYGTCNQKVEIIIIITFNEIFYENENYVEENGESKITSYVSFKQLMLYIDTCREIFFPFLWHFVHGWLLLQFFFLSSNFSCMSIWVKVFTFRMKHLLREKLRMSTYVAEQYEK